MKLFSQLLLGLTIVCLLIWQLPLVLQFPDGTFYKSAFYFI